MSSSPPERPSLTVGLAALKQKDYHLAIAHLQGICDREPEGTRKGRAQMGLAIAYSKLGQSQQAISVCQTLAASDVPQLQTWGTETLNQLLNQATSDRPSPPTPTISTDDPTDLLSFTPGIVPVPKTEEPTQVDSKNPSSLPQPAPEIRQWRQAGRAKRWGTLPKTGKIGSDQRWLWGLEIITAIAFFWWTCSVLKTTAFILKEILLFLPILSPWGWLYADPTLPLLILSVFILLGCPWMLSWLLKRTYQLEPLNLDNLKVIRPESANLIQRFCRQRKLPQPKLGILPTSTPIIFTYGNLPQTAKIVISQGTIDRLDDDELAILYGTQLTHIVNWDFAILSACLCFLQIPYTLYWSVAKLGERLSDRLEIPLVELGLWSSSLLVANLSYTFYQLWRWPLLLLSRWRLLYSDAGAVSLTGNPNGLTRALLKIAQAWHESVIQTHGRLESVERFDLLLPIALEQGIAIGNLSASEPFETALQWDLNHLHSDLLSLSSSHGRLGDRLQRLTDLARFFRLDSELNLPSIPHHRPSVPSGFQEWFQTSLRLTMTAWKVISQELPLLPSALFQSAIVGLLFRFLLTLVGILGYFLYIGQLVWLSQDQQGDLIWTCWLISFSLIVMMRINGYYPEARPPKSRKHIPDESETLKTLSLDPTLSPHHRPILRLQGKLLGRRGVHNGLGQCLLLHTVTGLVPLRHCPSASIFGDVGLNIVSPKDLIGQSVKVGGWFRRGSFPALELSYLQGRSPSPSWSYHPIFLSAIAIVCGLRGVYLIWQT